MNGATTEPLVSTISPPKMTISTSTGSSQNFFRASMKAAMSFRNDIGTSKRLLERFTRRRGLGARDPIRAVRLAAHPHRVDAEQPHREAGRDDRADVHEPEEDRIGDLVQQQAELAPCAIDAFQDVRPDKC